MAGAAVGVAGALYAALGKGDFDTAETFLAEDFVIHEPASAPFGGSHRGRDALRRVFPMVMGTWIDPKVEADGLVGDDRHAVMLVRFTMTSRVTGRTFTQHVTEVATVVDGLVSELRIHYFDAAEIAREGGAAS